MQVIATLQPGLAEQEFRIFPAFDDNSQGPSVPKVLPWTGSLTRSCNEEILQSRGSPGWSCEANVTRRATVAHGGEQ